MSAGHKSGNATSGTAGRIILFGRRSVNTMARAPEWGEMILPDRVRGVLYRDPAIFELELEKICTTWNSSCSAKRVSPTSIVTRNG